MYQSNDKLRAKRDSVFRTGRILLSTERELTCRVRNVSASGACVEHRGELSGGMSVDIAIGKDPVVKAQVMWTSETLAGIAFAGAPQHDDCSAPVEGVSAGWLADRPNPYRR